MRNVVQAAKPCVVCGSVERAPEVLVGEYQIFRCACGVRTLSPEPNEQELVEVFDDGSIYGEASSLKAEILAQNRRSLKDVEKVVAPGRLLDVGCGLGYMLEAARDRGWKATGVDPSPFSVANAQRNGFEAHHGLLDRLNLPSESFDALTLLQVVEHLLDPRELLAECWRLIRPGGAILVETPNPASLLARVKRSAFNYWIPPIHCVWYSPDSLARVLNESGFKLVRVATWSPRSRKLHDGVDVLASSKLGRLVPRRLRYPTGTAIATMADTLGHGTIVEAVAIRNGSDE
ncbi:MAG: methyltransferase domain-containing protein [Actinomycetota bacterium]